MIKLDTDPKNSAKIIYTEKILPSDSFIVTIICYCSLKHPNIHLFNRPFLSRRYRENMIVYIPIYYDLIIRIERR